LQALSYANSVCVEAEVLANARQASQPFLGSEKPPLDFAPSSKVTVGDTVFTLDRAGNICCEAPV
jgi:hypothetical protein